MTVDKPEERVTTLHAHDDYVYSVAFSADGRYLASGGDDCQITWHNKDVVSIPEQFRYRSGKPPATQFFGYKVAVGSSRDRLCC